MQYIDGGSVGYNIAVLIKVIPDLEQIKAASGTGQIQIEKVPLRLDILSEHAIETAVQLKEKYGGKVTGFIFGNNESIPLMKKAYAMGVDEGLVITGYKENNPALTASVISEKLKSLQFDIIVLGNQSADTYTGLLPGMIASKINARLIGNVLSIEIEGKEVKARKSLEKKIEVVKAQMPVVISVTQETNQPRLPPVMQIMAAGRKTIQSEEYKGQTPSYTLTKSRVAPKSERKKQIFEKPEDGIQAVVRVIKEEAR